MTNHLIPSPARHIPEVDTLYRDTLALLKNMRKKLVGFCMIASLVFICIYSGIILNFIYFYPLFMSFIWILGGIYFYFHWERHSPGPEITPQLNDYPFV